MDLCCNLLIRCSVDQRFEISFSINRQEEGHTHQIRMKELKHRENDVHNNSTHCNFVFHDVNRLNNNCMNALFRDYKLL